MSGPPFSRCASAYHGMEVWDQDSFGSISFDDEQQGLSHLGHIIENEVIHSAVAARQPV